MVVDGERANPAITAIFCDQLRSVPPFARRGRLICSLALSTIRVRCVLPIENSSTD